MAFLHCEIINESAMDYEVQTLCEQMCMNIMYINSIQK